MTVKGSAADAAMAPWAVPLSSPWIKSRQANNSATALADPRSRKMLRMVPMLRSMPQKGGIVTATDNASGADCLLFPKGLGFDAIR